MERKGENTHSDPIRQLRNGIEDPIERLYFDSANVMVEEIRFSGVDWDQMAPEMVRRWANLGDTNIFRYMHQIIEIRKAQQAQNGLAVNSEHS